MIKKKELKKKPVNQAGRLIPEQSPGETNPLFQTAINPQPPHPTSAGQ